MNQPLLSEEIKVLAQLKEDGVITQEQFKQATTKILARMSRRPSVAIDNETLWSFAGKVTLLFVLLVFGLVGWGALQIYNQKGKLEGINNRLETDNKTTTGNRAHIDTLLLRMGIAEAQIDELFDTLRKEPDNPKTKDE